LSLKEEEMETIKLRDEYIKLGQALKAAGLVGSGVDAKVVIQNGHVEVNGMVETQRGKKLYDGDLVTYNGSSIKIIK
jgi:ribosome-associated protein